MKKLILCLFFPLFFITGCGVIGNQQEIKAGEYFWITQGDKGKSTWEDVLVSFSVQHFSGAPVDIHLVNEENFKKFEMGFPFSHYQTASTTSMSSVFDAELELPAENYGSALIARIA